MEISNEMIIVLHGLREGVLLIDGSARKAPGCVARAGLALDIMKERRK